MADFIPQLLVEGTDDRYFLNELLSKRRFEKSPKANSQRYVLCRAQTEVEIRVGGGFDELVEKVGIDIKPGAANLGIVFDFDLPEDNHWVRLRNNLVACRYAELPQLLPTGGLVYQSVGPLPPLAVWGMPDNSSPGYLEDLAKGMVSGVAAGGLRHAEGVVRELPAAAKKFPNRSASKAAIQTWLAWQEDPGMRLGVAAKKGFLDVENPTAKALGDWLERWLA